MKALLIPILLTPALLAAAGQTLASSCSAQSGPTPATLVELYTSEGCNSCPPADRWLSSLKASRPDAIGVAFHVDYWDRLGWKDRFANPAYSERQRQTLASSGARFAYTPQLIVNGRDTRSRLALPAASRQPATVFLQLQRLAGEQVAVRLQPLAGAPARVELWWAVLEDGHRSEVKAGENTGVTLRHDAVVREYARLPAAGSTQALTLPFKARGEDAARPRRLLVVATDPADGRVLQAVELGC